MLNQEIPHMWGLRPMVASEIEVKGLTTKYGQNWEKLQKPVTHSIFELERHALPFWKPLGKGFKDSFKELT